MSEPRKLKRGYRTFYVTVMTMCGQKHSITLLCGPNGEACFASPLTPATAYEPDAESFTPDPTAIAECQAALAVAKKRWEDVRSRRTAAPAGPGSEPSQAKQDVGYLRKLAGELEDCRGDDTDILRAVADRLDASACEAGLGAMGLTPAGAGHDPCVTCRIRPTPQDRQQELVAENERLRKSALDAEHHAEVSLRECTRFRNERDATHEKLSYRAEKAETRVKELEAERDALRYEDYKPVVDAAVEWCAKWKAMSAIPKAESGKALIAAVATMQTGQTQEPKGKPITLTEARESAQQTMADADARRKEFAENDPDSAKAETPGRINIDFTDAELREIIDKASGPNTFPGEDDEPPVAPWLTGDELRTINSAMSHFSENLCCNEALILDRLLRRTADAKPPECPVTEEDVRDLGLMISLTEQGKALPVEWGVYLTRLRAHCRRARGEKEAKP